MTEQNVHVNRHLSCCLSRCYKMGQKEENFEELNTKLFFFYVAMSHMIMNIVFYALLSRY